MFQIINGRILSDIWINTRLKVVRTIIPWNLIKKDNKVLDLGAGEGTYLGDMFEQKGCYTIFADIEQELINRMPKKNKMCFDAQDLNKYFVENSFDWIITADMLEHIKDDKKVLEHIYNCLKPNGHALIMVPAYRSLYSKHQKDIGHYRRYDLNKFKETLKQTGFLIKKSRYTCSFLFPPLYLIQRLTDETKFYNKEKQHNKNYIKSKLEPHLKPLLNLITSLDSKLNLPFGTSLLFLVQKKENKIINQTKELRSISEEIKNI